LKESLRLPIVFLFFFIITIFLLAGLNLLSFWGRIYSDNTDLVMRLVLRRIPVSVLEMLPASVLLALILLLFRIIRHPGNRFLSFIIPLISAFLVLAAGYLGLQMILPGYEEIKLTPARYLAAGNFIKAEDRVLYVETLQDSSLGSILLVGRGNPEKNFSYYPRGRVEALGEELKISVPESPALVFKLETLFSSIFRKAPIVRDFLHDIQLVNRELNAFFNQSRSSFYFCCFSLVFSFLSVSVLMRISRWPLFNILLGFLVMRGFFYLFRFLREEIASEVGKILADQTMIQLLPILTLVGFGALMLLLDILFVPFRSWHREMEGE